MAKDEKRWNKSNLTAPILFSSTHKQIAQQQLNQTHLLEYADQQLVHIVLYTARGFDEFRVNRLS